MSTLTKTDAAKLAVATGGWMFIVYAGTARAIKNIKSRRRFNSNISSVTVWNGPIPEYVPPSER